MKKILLASALFISFNSFSQSDTTHKANKDSIPYAAVPLDLLNEIMGDIQLQASGRADVKVDIWKQLLQALSANAFLFNVPSKDPAKK